MPFTLLPAVDVAGGRVVRLGRDLAEGDDPSVDPVDAALAWQAGGATWIHLVDLDAAFGRGTNADLLAAVVGVLDVDVELSGGVVDDASLARALATGCTRAVLATQALADPAWCARAIATHGERVAVALDVRVDGGPDGSPRHRLEARGGTGSGSDSGGDVDLEDVLARLDRAGCARYIVTDVGRDGRLTGPDLDLYRTVARITPAPVVASGGIASLEDLVALARLAGPGGELALEGAVVGKALHAGRFTLPEALLAVRPPPRGTDPAAG